MRNSVTTKVVSTLVGLVTLGGVVWGASQVLATKATKIELAQVADTAAAEAAIADAKATYGLQARLQRNIGELTLLKNKPEGEKTADDWDQITFLRAEIQRLRNLISGDQ